MTEDGLLPAAGDPDPVGARARARLYREAGRLLKREAGRDAAFARTVDRHVMDKPLLRLNQADPDPGDVTPD